MASSISVGASGDTVPTSATPTPTTITAPDEAQPQGTSSANTTPEPSGRREIGGRLRGVFSRVRTAALKAKTASTNILSPKGKSDATLADFDDSTGVPIVQHYEGLWAEVATANSEIHSQVTTIAQQTAQDVQSVLGLCHQTNNLLLQLQAVGQFEQSLADACDKANGLASSLQQLDTLMQQYQEARFRAVLKTKQQQHLATATRVANAAS
eukprot:m.359365 g.359365  ORF g.359365 m.359365 type:complete len:211 (+) comp18542_c0_seq1:153-785(+)